ncbi:MAG: hypothetical protein K0Q72_1867 [Armatimonadetes bacterium]|jgi:hypothetical protein|nr:hypothetical protein [Armatimonadota bacterium]
MEVLTERPPAEGLLPARSRITRPARWAELLVILCLCGLAGWLCWHHVRTLSPALFFSFDTYFDADCSRNAVTMVSRTADQFRSQVHPLLPLMTSVPIGAARKLLHVRAVNALSLYLTVVAVLWTAVFYTLLRLLGCFRLDAAVFTVLAISSASAIHWLIVPESYALGSITIMLGLLMPLVPWRVRDRGWWLAMSSAITLTATVTNWMVGLVVTFSRTGWRRAAKITLGALGLACLLWLLQRALVPSSRFFLATNGEATFLQPLTPQRLLDCIRVMFSHVMLMPEVGTYPIWPHHGAEGLSIQSSPLASDSGLILAGSLVWFALVGVGFSALFTHPKCRAYRVPIAGCLLGQFLLHLVYGHETFLYSLHFLPLLLVVVASGAFTRFRVAVLVLSLVLAGLAVTHNSARLAQSVHRVPDLDQRRGESFKYLPPDHPGAAVPQ